MGSSFWMRFRTNQTLYSAQSLGRSAGKQKSLCCAGYCITSTDKKSSETLAGRVEFIELSVFDLSEINHLQKLRMRGCFPRSYLAKTEVDSIAWREGYILTFLERDFWAGQKYRFQCNGDLLDYVSSLS
jgi:predicted AAA+ superfamily ATPase